MICVAHSAAINIEADRNCFGIERNYRMANEVTNYARRTEDIALDLLKFVAAQANVGTKASGATTGFGLPSAPKGDDQVAHLLELYSKCRQAVEAPGSK